MFNINDIKNGMTFVYENNLYLVVEFQHVKPGKGAAFVRTKLKNLRTSSTIEKTFNTNIKLEKAIITKKTMHTTNNFFISILRSIKYLPVVCILFVYFTKSNSKS